VLQGCRYVVCKCIMWQPPIAMLCCAVGAGAAHLGQALASLRELVVYCAHLQQPLHCKDGMVSLVEDPASWVLPLEICRWCLFWEPCWHDEEPWALLCE
jgi:hypothetical protein